MYRYLMISTLLLGTIPFSAAVSLETNEENSKNIHRISVPKLTVEQARNIFQGETLSIIDENGREWKPMLIAMSKGSTYFSKDDLNFLSNQIIDIQSPSLAEVERGENNEIFYTATYFPVRYKTMPSNDPMTRKLEGRMELKIILKAFEI